MSSSCTSEEDMRELEPDEKEAKIIGGVERDSDDSRASPAPVQRMNPFNQNPWKKVGFWDFLLMESSLKYELQAEERFRRRVWAQQQQQQSHHHGGSMRDDHSMAAGNGPMGGFRDPGTPSHDDCGADGDRRGHYGGRDYHFVPIG